jgi:hypothetical protein
LPQCWPPAFARIVGNDIADVSREASTMMNGTDPRLVLDLAKQRSAELRAEAERYRLARWARKHAVRDGPTAKRRALPSPAWVLSWRRG